MPERTPDLDAAETGLEALDGLRELLIDMAAGARQFGIADPDHLATLIGIVRDHIGRALGKPA